MLIRRIKNAISSLLGREKVSLHIDENGWFIVRYGQRGESAKIDRVSERNLEWLSFCHSGTFPQENLKHDFQHAEELRQLGLVGPDTVPGMPGHNLTEDGVDVATQYWYLRTRKGARFDRRRFVMINGAALALGVMAVAVALIDISELFSYYALGGILMLHLLWEVHLDVKVSSARQNNAIESSSLTFAVYAWGLTALVAGAVAVAALLMEGLALFGAVALAALAAAYHAAVLRRASVLRRTAP